MIMKKPYNFSEERKRADHSSSTYNGASLLPMASNSSVLAMHSQGRDFPSSSSSSFSTDSRTVVALRVHSLAEKRRRERINTHLATLRRMTPNSSKMDKASLLARVIEQLRDLNRNAANINKISAIPSEMNQVTVECDNGGLIRSPFCSLAAENICIKATLCCNDRPDLLSDLRRAFHILRLKAIRAELTSVGGRTQNVFTLCRKEGNGNVCLSSLMESIRNILSKIASSSEDSAFVDQSEKKRRFLAANYLNMTV